MSPPSPVCGVCQEDITNPNPRVVTEMTICEACVRDQIVPQFQRALENEACYPVGWGGTELKVFDFADVLGDDFVLQFVRRVSEYCVLPTERVFCQHLVPVHKMPPKGAIASEAIYTVPDPDRMEDHTETTELSRCNTITLKARSAYSRNCWRCHGRICSKCGDGIFPLGPPHTCSAREVPIAQIAPDLIRGRDYQLCPNPTCQTPWALADGCNHMICPHPLCKTSFCFICGQEALEGTGHWSVSMPCPRYNQPNSPHAQFDVDEDGDDAEMGEDIPWTRSRLVRYESDPDVHMLVTPTSQFLHFVRLGFEDHHLAVPDTLANILEVGEMVIRFRARSDGHYFSFLRNTDLTFDRYNMGEPSEGKGQVVFGIWKIFEQHEDIARQATAEIINARFPVQFEFEDKHESGDNGMGPPIATLVGESEGSLERPGAGKVSKIKEDLGTFLGSARLQLSWLLHHMVGGSEGSLERPGVAKVSKIKENPETSLGSAMVQLSWLLHHVRIELCERAQLLPLFVDDHDLHPSTRAEVHYDTRFPLSGQLQVRIHGLLVRDDIEDPEKIQSARLMVYLNQRYDVLVSILAEIMAEATDLPLDVAPGNMLGRKVR